MGNLLSDLQRDEYFRDGLVFPITVLSTAEARRYRKASDKLEDRLGGRPRTVEVRQMHLHLCWAYDLAVHPNVLDAVEDVIGPNLLVWATELFIKHPRDNGVAIGWHQDRPYMGFQSGATVSAWIALADSTPTNGCMQAVPDPDRREANRGEINPQPGLPPKRRASAVTVDEARAVNVVLQAGEMSLHDIDVVHGSGPNGSDTKRIGFVVRYVTPEACPLEGRPPAVLARGRDDCGHFELVDPPRETDAETNIRHMRDSASRHLEAMLRNLRSAHT